MTPEDRKVLVDLCVKTSTSQLIAQALGFRLAIAHQEINTNPRYTFEEGLEAVEQELRTRPDWKNE